MKWHHFAFQIGARAGIACNDRNAMQSFGDYTVEFGEKVEMTYRTGAAICNFEAARIWIKLFVSPPIPLFLLWCGGAASAAAGIPGPLPNTTSISIMVASTGKDLDTNSLFSADDTVFGPVRKLENALAIARRLRSIRHGPLDISIELGSGTFRLEKPVFFGSEDSGTSEHPLTIRGQADGSTKILGTELLERAEPSALLAIEARLASAARGNVQVFKLPPVGVSSAAIARRKVVFPQPLGPIKLTNSPRLMARLTSFNA